ncbi:unnamed protein product, partial [Pocillopora meandrina]
MAFPSEAEGIVWCSIFTFASALIVIGNLLTIILFAVNKRLRKKSLVLVINMAVADLMLGAVSLPLYIYLVGISDYQLWTETLDLNVPFLIADILATKASLISATFISCERFYAIYWPFKHRTLTTRTYYIRTYLIIILMLWTISALDTALYFLSFHLRFREHYNYYWLTLGSISIAIMCGCNIAIWRKFRRRTVPGTQHQNRDLQNKRLTTTLLFVSILALLSWLPYIISNTLVILTDLNIPQRYLVAINFVNYSSAFINPIIYAFRIPEFRQALARSFVRRRATAKVENIE